MSGVADDLVIEPLPRTVRSAHGVVSLDPFAVSIRYHGKEGSFGGPYSFACTAVIVGAEARVFAGAGRMGPAVWRAIGTALRRCGVTHVTFERRNRPSNHRRRVPT